VLFDLESKTALITGGTRGIGLATGLAFGKYGTQTILTYRWGGEDETVLRKFDAAGAKAPIIVQADVSISEDTTRLMREIDARDLSVDIFVANATGAVSVDSFESLTERALSSSFRYSVWPLVEYLQTMKTILGSYPRYTVAMSTAGIENYVRHYDIVAASKAALEALCRYISFRLRKEDCRINVVRTRAVDTESVREIIGTDLQTIAEIAHARNQLISPDEVADVIVAVCSGLLDDMNAHVLTVDRGGLFRDNLCGMLNEWRKASL
jgi:NAD(P)-dependent dehydrogenase (short-subunit alcohol dehydrogenase family)